MKWIVGTNIAGYLPDSEPAIFDSWADAHQSLISEIGIDLDHEEDTDYPRFDEAHAMNLEDLLKEAKEMVPETEINLTNDRGLVYFLNSVVGDTKPEDGSEDGGDWMNGDLKPRE